MLRILLATCLMLALTAPSARGQHALDRAGALSGGTFLRGFYTMGGPLLWTDMVIHQNWRIQRNVEFGQYRLLDPSNRRMYSGTVDQCYRELDRLRRNGCIAPHPPHVVIIMHGLMGTRRLMSGLQEHLEERGGYTVLNFGYASTKGTIQEQTVALESVLRNLEGVQEVSLVCHSMSNIMVRHLLYRIEHQAYPPPVSFRRMVMISPPNNGARLASTVGQNCIIESILGDSVDQFARDIGWPCLEQQLRTPYFEFGILAGGRGNQTGFLKRAVPGDDDGLISIQTHCLPGAKDFRQVGGLHQLTPIYRDTKEATLKFLNCGHF